MEIKTKIKNGHDLLEAMKDKDFYEYVLSNTIPEPDDEYKELYQRFQKGDPKLQLTKEHNIKGRQYFLTFRDPDVIIYPVIRKTRFMMKDGKKFIALHKNIMNHFNDDGFFIPKGWLIITSSLCSKTGRFLLENDFMITSLLDLALAEDAELDE
ncbi:MAG: hypothetical protein NZ853_06210 [Leptospiraceae bacterium]|nr:hypothetical protein [Leptospiraceae bacterium]MDW7976455.1 hypothetical protein [Leptospiraceae bacterium]